MTLTSGERTAPKVRALPHDLVAEEALLGAILLSPAARDAAMAIVTPSHFFDTTNAGVYEVVCRLHDAGETVDPVVVAHWLGEAGPDAFRLVALMEACPAASAVESYAGIVANVATLRRVITTGQQISEIGYKSPADVVEALARVEELAAALEPPVSASARSGRQLVEELLDELEAAEEGRGMMGLPTGLPDLDAIIGGLRPGQLIVVGGRPSHGKTALATGMATHVGALGVPTYFASAEMSGQEVVRRMVAARARLSTKAMEAGGLSPDQHLRLAEATGHIAGLPMVVDDAFQLTIATIRAGARRLRSEHGRLGGVFVDYLQLMTGAARSETRQMEVSMLTRALKTLGRELECPVVVLSQLSRNLEQRPDKRPILADLRESGAIEQDADIVIFVYRDEMYDRGSADRGKAELIVAKNRNRVAPATAMVSWQGAWMRFIPLANPELLQGTRSGDQF